MAIQMLDTDRNEINAPVGRMEWLRADTLRPWAHQRDLNKAAVNKIARDFDPDTLGTLTVTRRDGINYLLDGQHRLAAIRDVMGWGDQNVPCVVYEGLTDEQEAKLFNGQAPGKRRALAPLHAMYVAYQSGDERAKAIVQVVERAGLAMAWASANGGGGANNAIAAASALGRTFDLYGAYRTQVVLELLRDGLGPTSRAYTGDMIQGTMAFWLRYQEMAVRAEMLARLRAAGVVGVLREATNMRAAVSGSMPDSVGRAIHKIYNHGRSARRLPEWPEKFVAPDVKAAGHRRSRDTIKSDFAAGIRKPTGAVGRRIAVAEHAAD